MNSALYSDSMVEIFDEYILLKNFYFLWMGAKKVAFSEVTEMRAIDLSFFDGRYRLRGKGRIVAIPQVGGLHHRYQRCA